MKVRALKRVTYGLDTYNKGDVFTTTEEDGESLIAQGFVEKADADD